MNRNMLQFESDAKIGGSFLPLFPEQDMAKFFDRWEMRVGQEARTIELGWNMRYNHCDISGYEVIRIAGGESG
jgi:hypothetical protein